MLHPAPIRKANFHRVQHRIGLPYPNYGIAPDELPILCRCFMDEGNFYVTHQQDIPTLYRNGCFGHSSITLRAPTSLADSPHEKKYYFQKRKERKDMHSIGEVNGNSTKSPSSPDMSLSSKQEPKNENGVPEDELDKLVLLPEEVIFLSFGVGCLSVQNVVSLETLGYGEIWKSLVQQNPDFPFAYAVYHYFRSKNWVPKSGVQYGGDYVLYHLGPEFYHSTYVVHIVGIPSRPKLTWCELHAIQRVAVAAKKNVLLCEIEIPKDFVVAESRPLSIFELKIRETVVTRWTPFGSQSPDD